MTTDGAANERAAAAKLVNEGNTVHCAAHDIQLAINDVLDGKQAHPPPEAARCRQVVKKCHDLVILVNGHKDLFSAFSLLAKEKKTQEGARMYDALVIDVETRWDSELGLMERVVYFDGIFLAMYARPGLQFPPECILDRFEFDLAYGMTLVLGPLRIFTKFVQNRAVVTLAKVPRMIDELITALRPGAFAALMVGRAEGVMVELERFQACLASRIKARFLDWFSAHSLALEALFMTPGPNRFAFTNFEVGHEAQRTVKQNIIDDLLELLPSTSPAATNPTRRQLHRSMAEAALELARSVLDESDATADPLVLWPAHPELAILFPVAKMLFAVPGSTAEDERSFSSSGFTLDQRRGRLDIDNFRREHRIRQYLTSGMNNNQQAGRRERLARAQSLLEEYGRLVEQAAALAAAAENQ